MGIIKEVATEVIKEVAVDAGLVAAGKGLQAGGKATGFISQKVDDIKDSRNKSVLKKKAKKEEYFLLVSAEKNLGDELNMFLAGLSQNIMLSLGRSWQRQQIDSLVANFCAAKRSCNFLFEELFGR